jgi:putative flippase GtrA
LHINPYIALISRLIVIVPINFILNKYWAFKDN